jgi:phosphatidylinositol alpha-1,6-mannosyltransferase
MKLIFLSNTDDKRTGYGRMTNDLVTALSGSGVEVILLLPVNVTSTIPRDICEIQSILPPHIYNFKTPKAVEHFLFKFKRNATLVHSLVEFPFSITGDRIARFNKIPHIVEAYGTWAVKPLHIWPEKYFFRNVYRRASRIITISDFSKETIISNLNMNLPISIIHPGIYTERFEKKVQLPSQSKEFVGDRKLLLTVGTLAVRKGQDMVLRALKRLKDSGRKDVAYLMVGGGNHVAFRQKIETMIHELDLSDVARVEGNVTEDELPAYFQSCDLYVHTPRFFENNFEGFGIVYLEAGACGKPVVATRSGGVPDAVRDGVTGFLVDEEDEVGLSGVIKTVLDNPNLAKKLGEGGYEYAQKHHWKNIVKQYLDVYNDIINKRD